MVGLPVREGGRSGQAVVTPGRAVAALPAIGLVEIVDLHDIPQLDALDEELCDPVTARDPDGFGRIEVDEVHLDLPPVARVDGPGSVDDGQARPRRQSGPRVHETHVPDGQRDGDSRRHEDTVSGCQVAVLRGVEIDPGVRRVRPDRQRESSVQPSYPEHLAGTAHPGRSAHHDAALLPGVARLLDSLDVVSDEDLRPPPDRAPRPVHSETLRVPVWWWLLLAAVTVVAVVLAFTAGARWWMWLLVIVVPALLAWLFVSLGRERIEVESDGQGGGTLYAGRARLPFDAIARSAVVPATAKQAAMGRQLDPEAFVVHRGYIPTMVIVVLDDPLDPTPYWLISTRDPEGLAAALPDNHYS